MVHSHACPRKRAHVPAETASLFLEVLGGLAPDASVLTVWVPVEGRLPDDEALLLANAALVVVEVCAPDATLCRGTWPREGAYA